MTSSSAVVSLPPDYIAELKCMLLVGNATGSFTDGVLCVKMVDNFLIEEKRMLKKIKKRNEAEAKAKFEEAHNELRSQFFSLTSVVQCLVHDAQHKEVLDCLKTAASKPRSCWQTVVCCLAAVIRGPQSTKESATAAYAALPDIIQHSRMLFFFLQVLKVAALNNKKAGFGRGLKSGVRKWYALLTPQALLLELWHAPHAYGWAHKDVMRLAHIRPCDLALGSRVVVQWYFSDLERTKIVFADDEEANYYISLLDQLFNREHESNLRAMQLKVLLEMDDSNCYRLVRQQDRMLHYKEILSSVLAALDVNGVTKAAQDRQLIKRVAPRRCLSQSSSHQQPPVELQPEESTGEKTEEVLPQEPEPSPLVKHVSSALVQRLQKPDVAETASAMAAAIAMNNFLRRVKSAVENLKGRSVWRGGVPESVCVPPSAPLGQRLSWHYSVPRHLRPVLALLDSTVLAAAKRCSIAARHPKMLVVFEPTSYCNLFLNTELGFNVHKQVRGTQAVSVCQYSLCYVAESEGEGFGDRAAVYVGGTFRSYHPPSNKDFKGVTANLETTCKENCDQYALDFSKLSSHCAEQGKVEVVYFCDQINKVFLTAMLTYLKDTPTGQGFTKLVLVGLMHTLLTPVEPSSDPRLLVLNGITERSVDVIQGFLDDDF